MSSTQNWITAYTQTDVDYVLEWYGKYSNKAISDYLNITELTIMEIVNVNKQQTTNGK